MGEKTVLSKATSKSSSLRTTVPAGVVKQLKLKVGDKLDWVLKADRNRLIVEIKQVSSGKKGEGV